MTQEWKPQSGEMCAVKVLEYDSEDGFMICEGQTPDQVVYSVPISALHPTPDPLTELERRVVEFVLNWRVHGGYNIRGNQMPVGYAAPLAELADEILAARALKDPVEEIKAAFALIDGERDPDCRDTEEWGRLRRAVAALEAAR